MLTNKPKLNKPIPIVTSLSKHNKIPTNPKSKYNNDIKKAIELIENGTKKDIMDGIKALKSRNAFSPEHPILKHYLILNPHKPISEPTFRLLLNEGQYEKRYPDLALKSYCFLKDKVKVKELLKKGANPNCQDVSYQNSLADCLRPVPPADKINEELKNANIIEILIEGNKHQKIDARTALLRASNNDLKESLRLLLKNKTRISISNTDLRDCLNQCITKAHTDAFKIICSYIDWDLLNPYKKYLENIDNTAKNDSYKRRYDVELKILSKEILKRRLKELNHEPPHTNL